jgi:diguanylate cyclase (GGDEF)-like protein
MFTGSQSAASAAATAGLAANVFLASIEFSRRSPTVGFGRNAVTWSLFGYIPFYAVSIGLGVLYEATRTGTTVILLSDIVLNIVFVVGLLAMTEERARSALFRLANFDPLTSSLNRRGLFDRGSAVSAERNCCVLVADLDHFKSINDTFGHAGGDAVLQAFVKTAQAVLGPRGLVGRLGGEEFAIVLVDAVHENGVEMAEAIRTHFLAAPVVWSGKSIKATVSIGVAASVIGQTFDETLQRADNALYRAKNDGRNQVAA